jgi:hypothetical protein
MYSVNQRRPETGNNDSGRIRRYTIRNKPLDIYQAVFFWPLAFRGFLLAACFADCISGRRLIQS